MHEFVAIRTTNLLHLCARMWYVHADGLPRFSRSLQARVNAAGLRRCSREAFRVAVGVQVTCARGGVGRREARRQGVERHRVPAGSAHRGGRNLEQRRREARHEAAEERPNIVKSPPQLYIFAPGLLPACMGAVGEPAAKPNRGTQRRAGIGQALVGRRYGHDDGYCRV